MFKKQFYGIVVLSFLLVLVSFNSVSADSTESASDFTENEKQEIIERMTELGVDEKDRQSLLEKLEAGETLDSMDPEKIQSVEDKLKVTLEEPVKKHVFPDGSVIKRSIEPTNQISAQSCTSQSCTYEEYKVSHSSTTISASFLANFTLSASGYSTIDYVHTPSVSVSIGTFSNQNLETVYETETSSLPARAQLGFIVNRSDASSNTHYLELDLQNGTISVSGTY